MTVREKWKNELVTILEGFHGKAHLSDLYESVLSRGIMDLSSTHWKSRVRDNLEHFSSDSDIFNGEVDLFYSVAGKGKGIWGLRSLVLVTPKSQDNHETDQPVRAELNTYRILRDTELARFIKSIYNNECQRCSSYIDLPDGNRYSEAHHVKPLGRPHNGPDTKDNILCLCPNCHVLMDYGVVSITIDDLSWHKDHNLNENYLNYHNNQIVPIKMQNPNKPQ